VLSISQVMRLENHSIAGFNLQDGDCRLDLNLLYMRACVRARVRI